MNKFIGGVALAGLICIASAASQPGGDSEAFAVDSLPEVSLELTISSSIECPNYSNGTLILQGQTSGGGVSDCFIADFVTSFFATQLQFSTSSFPNNIFTAAVGSVTAPLGTSPSTLNIPIGVSSAKIDITANASVLNSSAGTLIITASGFYLPEITFPYLNSPQTFTASTDGLYLLEVWGAGGGEGSISVAPVQPAVGGGYSQGTISLNAGEILYIYTGGKGTDAGPTFGLGGWNGGGNGSKTLIRGAGGGGGTDIRTSINASYADRIIVAGGAGGGGGSSGALSQIGYAGGVGGGLLGGDSVPAPGEIPDFRRGIGGTQSGGGSAAAQPAESIGTSGVFGIGGDAKQNWNSGGGGGGWYGGSGGGGAATGRGGGGGSGYISPTALLSGSTTAGDLPIPTLAGGTMIGNLSNGFARITFCGTTCD